MVTAIPVKKSRPFGLVKYTEVFSTIGWTCVGIAVLIALLNKPLNKLMHGVK